MRKRSLILLALAACACDGNLPAPVDRFVWELQSSAYAPAQSEVRGDTDAERFRGILRRFSWDDAMASRHDATCAVTDLLDNRTLFVSSDAERLLFRVGIVSPQRGNRPRQIDRCSVADPQRVDSLVVGFFARDTARINRLMARCDNREQLPEPISPKEYRAKIERYLNRAEQR